MKTLLTLTFLASLSCFVNSNVQALKMIKNVKGLPSADENLKCTEFKETLDSQFIFHVPCIFIRLMEHLKLCDLDTFKDVFLSKLIDYFYR